MTGVLEKDCQLDPNTETLTRHLMKSLLIHNRNGAANRELVTLLVSIQSAVKNISAAVRRAGLFQIMGFHGTTGRIMNIQGEEQQKLDVLANDIFINFLQNSYACCFLVSEEMENAIEIESEKQGSYVVCFDPLDGSNNIDCLASIGSIFAIYKRKTKLGRESPDITKDVLNPGRQLVAAGYTLYGAATMMVLTIGKGVNGYILNPTIGEFVLTKPDIRMKPAFLQYSVNESYSPSWDPKIQAFIDKKKTAREKPIPQRYIGTFIADFHRTLMYGGIFLYPMNKAYPRGKLRLLYECNPAAFIMEQAGGLGINGSQNILDIQPVSIHDRTQVFLGAKDEIEDLVSCLK